MMMLRACVIEFEVRGLIRFLAMFLGGELNWLGGLGFLPLGLRIISVLGK